MSDVRLLLVDDSKLIRRLVSDAASRSAGLTIVGEAENGQEAIDFLKANAAKVDAILLDLEMPVMDGLTTLRIIKDRWNEIPVVVFSSIASTGSAATIQALTTGAAECVLKPRSNDATTALTEITASLMPVLHALVDRRSAPAMAAAPTPIRAPRRAARKPPQIVVVGSSTGGPSALIDFLTAMGPVGLPVLLVQHIPATFTHQLAKRLADRSGLDVTEAIEDEVLAPGMVRLAPGGLHLEVVRGAHRKRTRMTSAPKVQYVRPSVDVLFNTAAVAYEGAVLGLVLTGMGSDGTDGARAIVDGGGEVLVQDEASSVVWGMPGSVYKNELATEVLSLPNLAAAVRRRVGVLTPQ